MISAIEFYNFAKNIVIDEGYGEEIIYVRDMILNFKIPDKEFFFRQYVYVVLCTYWKEQYARREWDRYFKTGDLKSISNLRKREAITFTLDHINKIYEEFVRSFEDKTTIDYLDTLPMIGKITKDHLARNLGIDTVKSDRHLIRVSKFLGYTSPRDLCLNIQKSNNEPLGVIDVVIWRMCNLTNIWMDLK